jgi:hypothetical protein
MGSTDLQKIDSQYKNAKNNLLLESNNIIDNIDDSFSKQEIINKFQNAIMYDIELIENLNNKHKNAIQNNKDNLNINDNVKQIKQKQKKIYTTQYNLDDINNEYITIKTRFDTIHANYKNIFWNNVIIVITLLLLIYYIRFFLF